MKSLTLLDSKPRALLEILHVLGSDDVICHPLYLLHHKKSHALSVSQPVKQHKVLPRPVHSEAFSSKASTSLVRTL
jgi:hypothetical protein